VTTQTAAQENSELADSLRKLIEIKDLTKVYGVGNVAVHALRGVNMTVERGEFVAIMGASGSGKSTLMNILGCLDRPTSGAYILDGQDVSRLSKNSWRVFAQENRLCLSIVQLAAPIYGGKERSAAMMYNGQSHTSDKERAGRALAMLESVGLGDRARHRPTSFPAATAARLPSRARSSTVHPSSWPTSRPAIWTPTRAWRSWTCCINCTTGARRL